jgi:DNA repair protein RecO (recombination protein O)
LTILTPNNGKLRLMAKGVRRVKSKLAGGIELFSVSDISYLKGRGEIGTLVSSQLLEHYGNIVMDLDRVQLGYALIKQLNRATEDDVEPEYFALLHEVFKALDDQSIPDEMIRLWFTAQLLRMGGHTPNLETDAQGRKLSASNRYTFDFEAVSFADHPAGVFRADSIKALRIFFSHVTPGTINRVNGISEQLPAVKPLIQALQSTYAPL